MNTSHQTQRCARCGYDCSGLPAETVCPERGRTGRTAYRAFWNDPDWLCLLVPIPLVALYAIIVLGPLRAPLWPTSLNFLILSVPLMILGVVAHAIGPNLCRAAMVTSAFLFVTGAGFDVFLRLGMNAAGVRPHVLMGRWFVIPALIGGVIACLIAYRSSHSLTTRETHHERSE